MRFFAVARTAHYTEYYLVRVETEEEVKELVRSGAVPSYTTTSRSDDDNVDFDEITEEEARKLIREHTIPLSE